MMTPRRYERIRALFVEAWSRPKANRRRFLCEAADGDSALVEEVTALLSDADRCSRSTFMNAPLLGTDAAEKVTRRVNLTVDAVLGRRIGAYDIEQVIGVGGMGRVYRALQRHPRRVVALKVMRLPLVSNRAALMRRFEYECNYLARLRHPNIAQIYDAGTFDNDGEPVPYFAMEFIDGAPITTHAWERRLSKEARLELFAQVCDAVHHGHQQGIIHRDLKPENILVEREGQPKIIDFGVARATQLNSASCIARTQTGQLMGTLAYMSPEQCGGDTRQIDIRSDVYSLGVVLFELMCGRLPYEVDGKSIAETARIIQVQAPAKPSSMSRALRGDLDTVALTALRKERSARYQSAYELAADIRRLLRHEPISAKAPSMTHHLRLMAKRNPAAAWASAAALIVLIAGICLTTLFAIGESHQRQTSQQITCFLQETLASANPFQADDDETIQDMLRHASRRVGRVFKGRPEAEAVVRFTIARSFAELWQWDDVADQAQIALDRYREVHGNRDPSVADCQTLLARALTFQHDARAASVARQAVETRTVLFGEHHPDTAEAKAALAYTYWGATRPARFDEAGQLYRESIADLRHADGDASRSADLARALLSYASMLMTQGQFGDEVEGALEEALSLHNSGHIRRDRYTTQCLLAYAGLLRKQGRIEKETEIRRQCLELTPRAFASDRQIRSSTWRIAVLLRQQGRYDESVKWYRRALHGECLLRRECDRTQADAWEALASSLETPGDLRDTARSAAEVMRVTPACQTDDDLALLGWLTGLTHFAFDRGYRSESSMLIDACLAFQSVHYARIDKRTARQAALLGYTLLHLGQYQRAQPLMLSAYQILQETRPPFDEDRYASHVRMMELYERWGRPNATHHYARRLLEFNRWAVEQPQATARHWNNYAWLLLTSPAKELRDPKAALPIAEKAVELSDGADAAVLDTLALACKMNSQLDRAIDLQRRALASSKTVVMRSEIEERLVEFLHHAKTQ